MSENTIILRGKVREFTKSYSGNLSFTVEDSSNILHYCFSTKKGSLVSSSDEVIIFGAHTTGNKVRINYIINKTRNTEQNLVETSQDWTYYLSLIASIGTTIGFIVAILFSVGLFPVDYGYMGMFGSFLSMIYSIVSIILLLPAMIILWVLTNSFAKKRRRGSEIEAEISKFRQGIPSPITLDSSSKPLESQMETEDYSKKPQFCAHCGTKVPVDAKFCPSCGSVQ
ncbi:MAG: zinc-ribbon domain-containing protein [Candidatus Lokiarchaeota archaeon]|nr:zinc-ribbon domain-containing protein [Candidatus Lokiarchaeota archaeon]